MNTLIKILKDGLVLMWGLGLIAWIILIWNLFWFSINWAIEGRELKRKRWGDGKRQQGVKDYKEDEDFFEDLKALGRLKRKRWRSQGFWNCFRAKCILFEVIKEIKSKETNIIIRVFGICFFIGMLVCIFGLIFP